MSGEPHLSGRVVLHPGDCREVLRSIPDASIDSVVTDPPYALVSIGKRFGKPGAAPAKHGSDGLYARAAAGFMGQSWDTGEVAFAAEFWAEVLRVLKPGGHLVAFSGTRTYHRMVVAIEDAGFEIRDGLLDMLATDTHVTGFLASLDPEQGAAFARVIDESGFGGLLAWVYGSGFPKSHDVAKGIDRHNGDERPVIGRERLSNDIRGGGLLDAAHGGDRPAFERDVTSAASAASAAWEGWGTALKPAWEPIVLARKPLDGTVAATVLEHGTGALNIDGCRIDGAKPDVRNIAFDAWRRCEGREDRQEPAQTYDASQGRWPANVIHDGSAEVVAAFPSNAGAAAPVRGTEASAVTAGIYGDRARIAGAFHGDGGSAARFFYSAKADAHDRVASKHPTVKPVDLMQWLCRLVTPPGGVVLDPFAGSGTTGEAAWREGFRAILIEREPAYCDDIRRRLRLAERPAERAAVAKAKGVVAADHGPLFGGATPPRVPKGSGRLIYGHFADQDGRDQDGRSGSSDE